MTRPLRKRHRIIVIALGVILPVLFAFGILARKPIPVNPPIHSSNHPSIQSDHER